MSFKKEVNQYFLGSTGDPASGDVSFIAADLPSSAIAAANGNDIREVLFSILDVFNTAYNALPAFDADPALDTQDGNTTISKTSTIASDSLAGGTTIRTTYTVSFLTSPADVNVVDAV